MIFFKNGVKYVYNVKCFVKNKNDVNCVFIIFLFFKVVSCFFIDNIDVGGIFVKNNEI